MKHPVVLLMALTFLTGISSCQITPGLAEPSTYICTIIDDKVMECVHTMNPDARYDISLIDGIGYQCLGPKAYGEMSTHHEVLHKELNRCKKGNR